LFNDSVAVSVFSNVTSAARVSVTLALPVTPLSVLETVNVPTNVAGLKSAAVMPIPPSV
jgi:hypothetical protein